MQKWPIGSESVHQAIWWLATVGLASKREGQF